jgi:hypothetical protein
MQFSAELRWFYSGALPNELLTAFGEGRAPKAEKPRTDRYLTFPGCETVGVKVRSYDEKWNFEVKALQGAAETVSLAPDVSGRLECWVKWSYGDQPVRPLVEALLNGKHDHRDVVKTRYLRKFSLDNGQPVEVPADDRPKEGCTVELTDLEVAGSQKWWTFAFEAFGKRENVRAHLLATTVHLFTSAPPLYCFHTSNSCSYATWMEGL